RSNAYLPLRLARRIDAPDPCRPARTRGRSHPGLVPDRGKTAHASRVSALVLEEGERTPGQTGDPNHLRVVCAGAPKSARIPRRARRSARLLAEARETGWHLLEALGCPGDPAARMHAGGAP